MFVENRSIFRIENAWIRIVCGGDFPLNWNGDCYFSNIDHIRCKESWDSIFRIGLEKNNHLKPNGNVYLFWRNDFVCCLKCLFIVAWNWKLFAWKQHGQIFCVLHKLFTVIKVFLCFPVDSNYEYPLDATLVWMHFEFESWSKDSSILLASVCMHKMSFGWHKVDLE